MRKKMWKRVRIAVGVYFAGKRLEQAREKLKRLYLAKEPNDSRRMNRARKRFNRLCDKWNVLVESYKKV